MDPRLLEYYNRELLFMREMGAEFAHTYPRIAARLGIDGIECADPYVERLLEGVAWLAARVQLKIDARHPEFTQHLLEMVYPQFLSPMPSCALAEFVPDFKDTALEAGLTIPRGSALQTQVARGERTACGFRTAQDVTLWPLTITEAKYISGSGALATQGIAVDSKVRAAVRLRFKVSPGVKLRALPLDALTFYIKATPDIASKLHEQVMANCVGFWMRSTQQGAGVHFRAASSVEQVGLSDDEALLPVTKLAFQGYRLLREYFAFPERFLYFRLRNLLEAVKTFEGDEFEIYIGLDRIQTSLENALDSSQFRLFTAPLINLFAKEADRLHVTPFEVEHHVLPDRNRPMDFEVFSIEKLTGVGAGGESQVEIAPFYAVSHRTASSAERAYYTVQRRQRLYSNRQVQDGARASYIGTECFVSVVDSKNRQWTGDFRQLDVQSLCTNRDLPIQISMGKGRTDFILDGAAPLEAIRCIAGPTYPRPSPAFGDTAWRLISHLTLNYLSLADTNPQSGAELLREMLSLYSDGNDVAMNRQIDGVRNIAHRSVVRRIPIKGPISYGRGLEIDITMDDNAFEGTGVLMLGSVLERFFPRYVSMNSFTQLRLFSQKRGEVKQWPVRLGNRQIL
jgi:type VI secretion system protein ImpG